MPYKDKGKRNQYEREKRALLRADPEKYRLYREYHKAYQIAHTNEKSRERYRRYRQRHRGELRQEILEHYGKVCCCCGEENIEFLAVDHIFGGGDKHRKKVARSSGSSFYGWLKRNNFPAGFRILCHNCNFSLGAYGYCPHAASLFRKNATAGT